MVHRRKKMPFRSGKHLLKMCATCSGDRDVSNSQIGGGCTENDRSLNTQSARW